MKLTSQDFEKILHIGIDLTTQQNPTKLLANILDEGMAVTHCDAATLYLYEEDVLKFYIMKTISQNICRGEDGDVIDDIPPVEFLESNVCAYCGIHRKIINIPDVYDSNEFDFSGPRNYDKLTGYHTRSMLVVPLENDKQELIGVLQLLNAMDEMGNVIPFHGQYETIIRSLGSLTAIKLTNIRYLQDMKNLLHSFVEAFATAIDERTPYNGNHTRKVAMYAEKLAMEINEKYRQNQTKEYFDEERLEKLKLAALLHDIGKMIVPVSVMNRATRLEGKQKDIEARFQLLEAYYKIDYLEGRISKTQWEEQQKLLKDTLDFVKSVDKMGYVNDDVYHRVQEIGKFHYKSSDGKVLFYLNQDEKEALSIRKGTLTAEDRKVMESHVEMTAKILSKVHFDKTYENVPKWAGEHHEYLDGSGYPKGLTGEELDLETRILTIADIYDAMTATDRPYKQAIPREKVIKILLEMAEEGKLDRQLVYWLDEGL